MMNIRSFEVVWGHYAQRSVVINVDGEIAGDGQEDGAEDGMF